MGDCARAIIIWQDSRQHTAPLTAGQDAQRGSDDARQSRRRTTRHIKIIGKLCRPRRKSVGRITGNVCTKKNTTLQILTLEAMPGTLGPTQSTQPTQWMRQGSQRHGCRGARPLHKKRGWRTSPRTAKKKRTHFFALLMQSCSDAPDTRFKSVALASILLLSSRDLYLET